jgi:hypothetical protein
LKGLLDVLIQDWRACSSCKTYQYDEVSVQLGFNTNSIYQFGGTEVRLDKDSRLSHFIHTSIFNATRKTCRTCDTENKPLLETTSVRLVAWPEVLVVAINQVGENGVSNMDNVPALDNWLYLGDYLPRKDRNPEGYNDTRYKLTGVTYWGGSIEHQAGHYIHLHLVRGKWTLFDDLTKGHPTQSYLQRLLKGIVSGRDADDWCPTVAFYRRSPVSQKAGRKSKGLKKLKDSSSSPKGKRKQSDCKSAEEQAGKRQKTVAGRRALPTY